MKRPSRRSRRKPKNALAPAPVGNQDHSKLLYWKNFAQYIGSPYHKQNPASYNMVEPKPKPDKTLCDTQGTISLSRSLELLQNGISKGMVSEQMRGCWPQNIWTVDNDTVYECQLQNQETGEYHGYPMLFDDDFAKYLKEQWLTRDTML